MISLGFLGIAKKAGKIETGEEQVLALLSGKKARLVILAEDAADNVTRRIERFFGDAGAVIVRVPYTKAQLGGITGRSVCAVAALTDIGFAAGFAEKLNAEFPERYTEALERLKVKAERAKERKREQRAHEKNSKTGGRRRK